MMGQTHRAAGVLAGLSVAVALEAQVAEALLLTITAAAGAHLPDYDSADATLARLSWRLAPVVGLAFFLVTVAHHRPQPLAALCVAFCLAAAPYFLQLTLSHRGPLHSLLLWSFLGVVACYLAPQAWRLALLGACAGALGGGILPDLVTGAGTQALWPFSSRRWRALPAGLSLTTDGLAERFLVRPLLRSAAVCLALFYLLRNH